MQWIALAAVISWLLYLLGPVLSPFVAAGILAYICNPLVNRLCAWNWPRSVATVTVMLAILALLGLLALIMLPLLQQEAQRLTERLPDWLDALRNKLLPQLQQMLGVNLQWDAAALRNMLLSHLQGAGGVAEKVLPWLGGGGAALLGAVMKLVLIPLALFYLLRDWNVMLQRIEQAVPRRWHDKALQIAREVDAVLAEFLRGQISVMLLMSAYYVIALWLAGLEFALPIGIVTGMLVFVPYLGMIAGLLLATLAAAMQFSGFGGIVLVWVAFGIGQALEGMAVTPWLVGERIGLHPLAVIFALLAFGQLFGFFGVLLALPLSAVLLVLQRHGRDWYLSSPLYRD
jgi:predicted PurR-regulated permease PerM